MQTRLERLEAVLQEQVNSQSVLVGPGDLIDLLAVVDAARHLRDTCGSNDFVVGSAVVALDKAIAKLNEVQP